MKTMCIGRRIF